MTVAIFQLGVVGFDDPELSQPHPGDPGKRENNFGVPLSFNFEVAFMQLGELILRRVR
jgi:hypothetical protein